MNKRSFAVTWLADHNYSCITAKCFIIISSSINSAKEIMFNRLSVCLFGCWQLRVKTSDWMVIKNFTRFKILSVDNEELIKFWMLSASGSDPGIF